MNPKLRERIDNLHLDLGLKRLNPIWAKIEIVGGLAVAGIGLKLWINDSYTIDPTGGWIGLTAFVLGAYLAMAGHRSHLYQSNNLLAAWLHSKIDIDGPEETSKTS